MPLLFDRKCKHNLLERRCQIKRDQDKTKEQLINELAGLRQRIAELEVADTERKKMEEALRKDEEKLKRMFEYATDGIVVTDLNGNIMELNEAAVRLHGSDSKEKLIGQSTFELIAERDRVRAMEILKSAKEDGQIRRNVEISFLTEDGREYFAEVSGALLRDAAGNSAGFIAMFRDITKRKQVEEDLQRRNEFIETIINNLPIGLAVNTIDDGIARYENRKFEEIYGWPKENLVNVDEFFNHVYPDPVYRKEIKERILSDINSGDPSRMKWENIIATGKDGKKKIISAVNIPLIKQNLMISTAQDITEFKQAEQALRESERRYRLLAENAEDVIWTVDMNMRPTYMSPSITRLLGYSVEETMAKPMEAVYTPASFETAMKALAEELAIENMEQKGLSRSRTLELELNRKDGSRVPVEVKFSFIRESDGRPVKILAIARDITERKKGEEKAREVETLKEVDRMRSGLLANVSHELRTPLTSIKGFATTLLRPDVKWSEEDQRDFLQSIDQETERLIRLINDLLDMSRIEAGGLRLEKQNYQIADILNSVNSKLASFTEHHQLQVTVPSELPPVFVDQMRIRQVLTNLVENATKFSSEDKQITIEAQLAGDQIIVSVTDRGQGIPAELLDKVFDRFYQAKSIVSGLKSGIGLGLSICKGIIESHGGRIWVESNLGEGSKFSFSLPVGKSEEDTT